MYERSKLVIIVLTASVGGRNYVPKDDLAFVMWAQGLYDYADENSVRFGILPVDADVTNRLKRFSGLALKCNSGDHIKADEVEKHDLRKIVEKDARNFVQGTLARNIKVTNRDRELMHIPVYDNIRTPVGVPEGQAAVTVSYPGRAQLKLHIHHIEDTPFDRKADYGCRVYYKLCAADDPQPASGHELAQSKFTRRKIMGGD